MTNTVKKLAPVIWQEIANAKSVLMHFHPGPDGDSVGSVLALMHVLESKGKQVTVIKGDSEKPASLSHLPGFEKIIDKNFLELDLSLFDLFLIIDTSSPEQVTKLGPVNFPDSLRTVVIDHHSTSDNMADINLVDKSYPAVGQILYELFKSWGVPLTADIAACLFVAVYTDTGGFKYPLTNVDTFLAAADMAEANGQLSRQIFYLENSNSAEHIAYIAFALSSINTFFSGRVGISAVSYKQLRSRGIKKSDTEKSEISNTIKSIIGREIGIALVETEPDIISVSFRTRDSVKFNVARIAKATGSGGGHPAAAAANLKLPFSQAQKYLLEKIKETYPELGKP